MSICDVYQSDWIIQMITAQSLQCVVFSEFFINLHLKSLEVASPTVVGIRNNNVILQVLFALLSAYDDNWQIEG